MPLGMCLTTATSATLEASSLPQLVKSRLRNNRTCSNGKISAVGIRFYIRFLDQVRQQFYTLPFALRLTPPAILPARSLLFLVSSRTLMKCVRWTMILNLI